MKQEQQLRFIRMRDVVNKTGLSQASIYRRMNEGQFPSSISIGANRVAWVEHEVDEWMRQQIEQSRVA